MTIASEIADLQTNLANAKAAVTAKGGTVGDTGLAGLASEIAAIPGGGGPDVLSPITSYGRLFYYANTTTVYSAQGTMCTVTIDNQNLFDAFCAANYDAGVTSIDYDSTNAYWYYFDPETADQVTVNLADIGLSVVWDDPSMPYGSIYLGKTITVDKSNGLSMMEIDTLAKYNDLCSIPYRSYAIIGGVSIYSLAIYGFAFGQTATSIPNSFLSQAEDIVMTDTTYATNVTTIGNSVKLRGYGTILFPNVTTIGNSLSMPNAYEVSFPLATSVGNGFTASTANTIRLPEALSIGNNFSAQHGKNFYLSKVRTIGDYFLNNVQGLINQISLPKVETIGSYFFAYGGELTRINYTGGFTFPATLTSVGIRPFMNCGSFTGRLNIQCPVSAFSTTDRNMSFAGRSSGELIYTSGFSVYGTNRSAFASAFPTQSSGGFYRKVTVGSN